MNPRVYLQYHNCETLGNLPHPWRPETQTVQIHTKVRTARQAAGQVILIAGLGSPRRYYLWSTFTIGRCLNKPGGVIQLEGTGWQLAPPVELTGADFQQFKAACANFIGFREITSLPYARKLLQFTEKYCPPGDGDIIAKALQAMQRYACHPHIKTQLQSNVVSEDVLWNPYDMVALSIRQPHAEAILRGIKKVEYRSQATTIRGRVLIYASRIPVDDVPSWMKKYGIRDQAYDDLPRGVIVGSVEIHDCQGGDWHLCNPQRATKLLTPRNRPQPIWFYPFK